MSDGHLYSLFLVLKWEGGYVIFRKFGDGISSGNGNLSIFTFTLASFSIGVMNL